MRAIQKRTFGGHHLDAANSRPPTTAAEASSRWSSFNHKAEVTQFLREEQYGLCAYSEIRPDTYALGTHVEHVEPKSQNPQRTFDYSNLVLSALSDDQLQGIDKHQIFGGHHKGNEFDPALFISCLADNSADYFAYFSNGHIEPKSTLSVRDKRKAQYTIDLLNLDSPYLVAERRCWLDELDTLIDEHIERNWSLTDLAAVHLLPMAGVLDPFFSATYQRFGPIAKQLLQQHAPELIVTR